QSFKNGSYEEAIEHFKNAVNLDSDLRVAKMYLATAYAQQFVPGVDSPDNIRNAQLAIEQYKDVLSKEPSNVASLKGIAYLNMQQKKFDEARTYYKKAIDADPNDPETYYSVGVIDWTETYKDAGEAKVGNGKKPDDELKGKGDQKICDQMKAK